MMSKVQPSFRATASALGMFGRLHEAKMQDDAHEAVADRLHLHAVLCRDAREVFGDDGQDDIVLMQHLVVLQAVQQRGGRAFRCCGEEHGRAGNAWRRLFLQRLDQRLDRHLEPPCLGGEDARAPAPGEHDGDEQAADQERHPAALRHLEQIGNQEGEVDQDERQHQRQRRPERPVPHAPDHDEAHQTVDQHGAGDGDAIGGCERVR